MRQAAMLFAAVLAVIGLGFAFSPAQNDEVEPRSISDFQIGHGPATFDETLAEANSGVSAARKRFEAAPGEWLKAEALALALSNRFRLTGDHADLAEAERLVDKALASAPFPSGPTLTAASLALTDHGLDRADRALGRYDATQAKAPADVQQTNALRGDVMFQRGSLSAASKAFEAANAEAENIPTALRKANAVLWSGKPALARSQAEKTLANTQPSPGSFARTALFMANLSYASGDIERAGEWVAASNKAFSGYWLADAYAGQQRAAEGDIDGAIEALEKLARKHAEPDLYDTLVGVLLFDGQKSKAAQWAARSAILWDERLEVSRQAYRLHASEHHLDFGDPARAVELAKEEVAARPFGEAIEVYASALTATGKPAEALKWLERAEADGWRAVSLDLARYEALLELGREQEAERYLDRAKAINPLAGTDERKLVRFGHF